MRQQPSGGDTNDSLTSLLQEASDAWKSVETYWLWTERAIGFGFTVVAIAFVQAARTDYAQEAKIFLPIALGFVYSYGLNMLNELVSRGAYRAWLENKIIASSASRHCCGNRWLSLKP